jgi:hypothetical protein
VNVGLFLGTNVSMLSSIHQLVMYAFDAVGFVIICSPFEHIVSLGFLVKQWQGILGTLTLFTKTKLN